MKSVSVLFLLSVFLINPRIIQSQSLDTLVDVGGHLIHFNIKEGKGIPILFESGGGNDASIWNMLLEPIHDITGATLITYDRNGYGRSEYNSALSNDKKALITNGINDLEVGLSKLGYDQEIVLVAHSYGGFYSTYFAHTYPERVKGVVLIDANLSNYFDDEYVNELKEQRTEDWLISIKNQSLPVYYECLSFYETIEIMREIDIPHQIPVMDIVAGNSEDRWRFHHKEFVELSPQRHGITAVNCNHYLHFDNPMLAIYAIARIYSDVDPDMSNSAVVKNILDYGIESSNRYKEREHEYWHSEFETNSWGYQLLNDDDNIQAALQVFELNTMMFPNSSNVWDSYGEALLRAGNKVEAMKMYQRSIELNPKNENGKRILAELLQER